MRTGAIPDWSAVQKRLGLQLRKTGGSRVGMIVRGNPNAAIPEVPPMRLQRHAAVSPDFAAAWRFGVAHHLTPAHPSDPASAAPFDPTRLAWP